MISVVVPTHNRPDDLLRALRSLKAQSCPPREVIVVDDGSQPAVSAAAIDSVCPGMKVILIRNDSPAGANHARNVGVQAASSDWIAFLDDDDEFHEGKICRLIKEVSENPECDVIYHAAEIRMLRENVKYYSRPGDFEDHQMFSRLLIRNEIGGTSMVAVRRSVFLEAGGFDEKLPALQDHEMWMRLASRKARFKFINQPLTYYNYDTGRGSTSKNVDSYLDAIRIITSKYSSHYEQMRQEDIGRRDANIRKVLIHRALLSGNKRLAYREQFKQFIHSKKATDLMIFFVVLMGPRVVFKLNAWMR